MVFQEIINLLTWAVSTLITLVGMIFEGVSGKKSGGFLIIVFLLLCCVAWMDWQCGGKSGCFSIRGIVFGDAATFGGVSNTDQEMGAGLFEDTHEGFLRRLEYVTTDATSTNEEIFMFSPSFGEFGIGIPGSYFMPSLSWAWLQRDKYAGLNGILWKDTNMATDLTHISSVVSYKLLGVLLGDEEDPTDWAVVYNSTPVWNSSLYNSTDNVGDVEYELSNKSYTGAMCNDAYYLEPRVANAMGNNIAFKTVYNVQMLLGNGASVSSYFQQNGLMAPTGRVDIGGLFILGKYHQISTCTFLRDKDTQQRVYCTEAQAYLGTPLGCAGGSPPGLDYGTAERTLYGGVVGALVAVDTAVVETLNFADAATFGLLNKEWTIALWTQFVNIAFVLIVLMVVILVMSFVWHVYDHR